MTCQELFSSPCLKLNLKCYIRCQEVLPISFTDDIHICFFLLYSLIKFNSWQKFVQNSSYYKNTIKNGKEIKHLGSVSDITFFYLSVLLFHLCRTRRIHRTNKPVCILTSYRHKVLSFPPSHGSYASVPWEIHRGAPQLSLLPDSIECCHLQLCETSHNPRWWHQECQKRRVW